MSNSEDYLDSLLNSINRAKSDAKSTKSDGEVRSKSAIETHRRIAPDEDFMEAHGLYDHSPRTSSRSNLRRAFSESDFLREFEMELDDTDANSFLEEFELSLQERRTAAKKSPVANVLDDIAEVVTAATDKAEEEFDTLSGLPIEEVDDGMEENTTEDQPEVDTIDFSVPIDVHPDDVDVKSDADIKEDEPEEDISVNIDIPSDDDDEPEFVDNLGFDISFSDNEEPSAEVDLNDTETENNDAPAKPLSAEDIMNSAMEDSDDDSSINILDEFAPDELDEEEPSENPLDALVELIEDEQAGQLDIQSIMDGGDIGIDLSGIDLSADEEEDEPKKGKKKKKDKSKPSFLDKLKLILFGAPDEDEFMEAHDAEVSKNILQKDPNTLDDHDREIYDKALAKQEAKEKKEKDKAEKAEAKEAAKKEKAAAKEAAKKEKPKKEAKPKKPKKPKPVDNSPKIPIGMIAFFLVLSASMLAFVLLFTKFFGISYHMKQAEDLFNAGSYIEAFEKTNGLDIDDEEDVLLRNQARMLADIQQKNEEALMLFENGLYDLSLDSYIQGIGRYEKYKADADNYGIGDKYDELGQLTINDCYSRFKCSKEEAYAIYCLDNRHDYTVELRKILIRMGME